MNKKRTRTSAALLALLFVLLSAFPVFAGEGDGDGSGDGGGRETPLTLASSSVPNGSENVDPNVRIVLTFTKNVVHFNVKENNMKCFSVKDSGGDPHPITVEMGDDQIDPDIKRIVTIVPQTPYKSGETYILKISKGLTAKNEENILEKDVYLSFTIRENTGTTTTKAAPSTTRQNTVRPNVPQSTSTTTTTSPAETTAKRVTTTRPPITAATKASTTAVTTNAQTTKQTTTASAKQAATENVVTTFTAAQTTTRAATLTTTASSAQTAETASETVSETVLQTSAQIITTEEMTTAADKTTETVSETTLQETELPEPKGLSPSILIGILIAFAAAAAAVFIIMQQSKKKG